MTLKTPILFIIFNRPDTTQKVFEAIRQARPMQLFVTADGPRDGNEEDEKRCEAARSIIKQVDWDCEVKTLFRDKNLGCKMAVSSAIDWFFENTERGIILEDDCLPSRSFFLFCQELLTKYEDNEKVMMISGDNFQFGKNKVPYDYYFSKKFFHIWGWATWKRAWKHYDVEMKKWPEIKNSGFMEKLFGDKKILTERKYVFDKVYSGLIDTWDYQWTFACMLNDGLCILPNKNLVSNIGFDDRATHTQNTMAVNSNLATEEMRPPLKHPDFINFNEEADNFTSRTENKTRSNQIIRILRLIKNKIHGRM